MDNLRLALAILALAILGCSIQTGQLPTQSPAPTSAALAIAPKPQIANAVAVNATVTAQRSLNVRAGPSRTYAAIGALYFGERVELTGVCKDGWTKIIWKDRTAWVYSGYLSDNSCKETKK